jgi:hypothetical protein
VERSGSSQTKKKGGWRHSRTRPGETDSLGQGQPGESHTGNSYLFSDAAGVSGPADFAECFLFFALFGFSVFVFESFFTHLIGL